MLAASSRLVVWGALLCVARASAQQPLELHGYIQGRLTHQPGIPARLEVRRARLGVIATPLPKLTLRLQADFAKPPYLMDASASYRFAQPFSLTIGQMKVPFSTESLISDDHNSPVSRARAVLALSPGRDTGLQARDVGALASGTIARNGRSLDYSTGIFRGQTFIHAPQVHYHAVAGRLIFHPRKEWSLGADWYGTYTGAPNTVTKRRLDLEAEYDRGRAKLRAEQILARDGSLERRGGYLLGVYRLVPAAEVIARADWYVPNVHRANALSIAYVAGGNLILWKHLKMGLNAGAQHDGTPNRWSSVVVAQIMPFF